MHIFISIYSSIVGDISSLYFGRPPSVCPSVVVVVGHIPVLVTGAGAPLSARDCLYQGHRAAPYLLPDLPGLPGCSEVWSQV